MHDSHDFMKGMAAAAVGMVQALLLLGALSTPGAAQESDATQRLRAWSDRVTRQMFRVSEDVYTAVGYTLSANSMIIGDDGIIIVDPGHSPALSAGVRDEFEDITNKPIRAIIYTHGHGDHTRGASAFADEDADIEVWARANFNAEPRAAAEAGLARFSRPADTQGGDLPEGRSIAFNGPPRPMSPEERASPVRLVPPTRTFDDERIELEIAGADGVERLIERAGAVPLPPYIRRAADDADAERYQTVYARRPGAVAAPTAGLHFDETLLAALRERGVEIAHVTLHVGAGTFAPIRGESVKSHALHCEWVEVSDTVCEAIARTRARGARVVSVGTTTLRALESAAAGGEVRPMRGETELFIYPGYEFRCVDVLLTNFHLPRSSLLLLVCAFGGTDAVLGAYREAVARRYRFFSYGDAMLLERTGGAS